MTTLSLHDTIAHSTQRKAPPALRMLGRVSRCVMVCSAFACGSVGQEPAQVPLLLAGAPADEPTVSADGLALTVNRADVAFGPLYLCAATQAGSSCDTARLEWLDSAIVDATDTSWSSAGELRGITGPVRSWMYDMGISSQLDGGDPFVLTAAADLGGASVVLEGTVEARGTVIPFAAAIPIQQGTSTEQGVPVIRKSQSEDFNHEVRATEVGLGVRFDPHAWLAALSFGEYFPDAECAPGGPTAVCDGNMAVSCNEDGSESSRLDCGESSQVCTAGGGCTDELSITEDAEAFRRLRNAITFGSRASFEWGVQP